MKTIVKTFFLVISVLFFSCENEDKNELENETVAVRMKQLLRVYSDGSLEKYDLTYENDKLSTIINYMQNDIGVWEPQRKDEISYVGENATRITYRYDTESYEMYKKTEFTINNSLLVEEIEFYFESGNWELDRKFTYQYENNELTIWKEYDYNGDMTHKGEYLYENGELVDFQRSLLENGTWYSDLKEVFSYDNGQIKSVINYSRDSEDESFNKSSKDVYFYANSNVNKISRYYWDVKNEAWELRSLYLTISYLCIPGW